MSQLYRKTRYVCAFEKRWRIIFPTTFSFFVECILGGCKHAIAFIMWLHEKSNTPAPTQTECYWRKPKLSRVNDNAVATLADFGKPTTSVDVNTKSVVNMFLAGLTNQGQVLFAKTTWMETHRMLDMHHTALTFPVSMYCDIFNLEMGT